MPVSPTNFVPATIAKRRDGIAKPLGHVQILHQPPHRRHGDFHHHGHRRAGHDGLAAHRAIPQGGAPGNLHSSGLRWRRRADHRAIRGHSHRTTDERRGQHELHVLGQRQQRFDAVVCQLRSRDRPEYRPRSDPVALRPGGTPVARRRAQLRSHGPKIPLRPFHDPLAQFAQRLARRRVSGQLRLYQFERPPEPGGRGFLK